MERRNRILRGACQALVAALMAGCGVFACLSALGFAPAWPAVYLCAALSAAAVQLGRGGPVRFGCAAAFVLGASALALVRGAGEISAALKAVGENGMLQGEIALTHVAAGRYLGVLSALLLGALFALLLRSASGTPFALMILLAAVICSLAVNANLSLWIAVPGLMAGVAAFGLPGEGRFGGVRAAVLVPAAVLTLVALAFVPGERTTWEPLESLANRVRAVVEDYIHFTQQRVAFSIHEKGYDHAGMVSDNVVAMLGGPADPSDEPVMRVEGKGDLLLRGAIRRSYTGYSWVDDQSKARYLYYDMIHRGVRSDVFGMNISEDDPNFEAVHAQVEMLADGTSTLFVPAHLTEFSMSLANAVYYNSIGEIFLTREVEAGDRYALSAMQPVDDAALMRAAASAQLASDSAFERIRAEYTALPSGIDESVYALAVSLTQHDANPAAKALAIENHLANNYTYTLDGGYPEAGRDFVSWFLNESKEGYCSYFASAMTVLCRIAGLPARYVEGYYVRDGREIVTGENAHAWTEVYLSGLGWTAFDPTARAMQLQGDDLAQEGGEEAPHSGEDHPGTPPDTTPTPSPAPDDGEAEPEPDDPFAGDSEPTPSPAPDNAADPPAGGDSSADAPDDREKNSAWLWFVLVPIIILLALAAYFLLRRRLQTTDPLQMAKSARTMQTASLILYRGILNVLAQAGQVPASGETPAQFAQRVVRVMPNADYEAFVADVVRSRYSGKGVNRHTVELGRNAYAAFLQSMGRGERLRYHLRRLVRGLGSTEMIP